MDQRFTAQDELLKHGPRPLQLPHPDERRRLRELWGVSIEEVASALNQEPDDMAAWESGQIETDLADTYAYLRLLNGFRERMPQAYEPDWAALRPPPARCLPAPRPQTPALPEPTAAPATIKAAHRGARWTEEARSCLRDGFLAGTEPAELAHELGRSETSIRWQLYRMELAPFPAETVAERRAPRQPERSKAYTVEDKRKAHPNAYKPWTAHDEAELAARCAQGASLSQLAREFGRNEGAIAGRLLRIDAEGPAADEAWEFGG